MEIVREIESGRVSNPRGGKRDNAGSGGKREGAGRPSRRGRDTRARNWLTVVYPESLKPDWRQTLASWHVPALVSPLHDKDANADGKGTPKKPHYHILLMYRGKKSYSQMCELLPELLVDGHVEPLPCEDVRGSARYLCHMDNPDKYQYPIEDVAAYSGANYFDIVDLPVDRERYIREMCQWCRATGCISYAELMDEAALNHPDWFACLVRTSTMVMFRYIRSLEDEMAKGKYRKPSSAVGAGAPLAEAVRRITGNDAPLSPLEQARCRVRQAEIDLLAARQRLEAEERAEAQVSAAWADKEGS